MHKVFIISQNLMFGYGLKSLLNKESNINIIGQESDTLRAHQQIKKLQPDTVIIDTSRMLDQAYAELIKIVSTDSSPPKIIFYGGSPEG